jgi:Na+:H+ antiporter, NhaA family
MRATRSRWHRVRRLARHDRASGVGLTAATVVALVWANWPASSYASVWAHPVPGPHWLGTSLTYRDWVNQGLMVAFFALAGLEIRREAVAGELRTWRRAAVPVMAALGGMVVPALIYALVVAGGPGARGWGIPMATDVAFALGALALVGRRASPRVRVFLLTLAVADDVASIVVLVCFYSRGVRWVPLLIGIFAIAAMVGLHVGARLPGWAYLALGAVSWVALVDAGVEAAIVGVALGLLAPPRSTDPHRAPTSGPRHWERRLQPPVFLVVLPVFALANTGVRLAGSGLTQSDALRVFAAVLVARVVGKPLGIAATTWVASHRRRAPADPHLPARQVLGLGALASAGFTVSLLVVAAALPVGPLASAATLGLLVGTVVGLGLAALLFRRGEPTPAR